MIEPARDPLVEGGALSLRTKVLFGAGTLASLGEVTRDLGASRAFVVTDQGVAGAGHLDRARAALSSAGVTTRTFTAVRENPTSADVASCVAALGDWPAEVLVGLGGGSSIDVAKGCAFVRAGGGRMDDYQGFGRARGTLLPLVAIPTTAGTGSEVQSYALIADDGDHGKMACGDVQAAPRVAILDPTLTVSQPRVVTACAGCDALVHAVETAVTTRRSPFSLMFSTAAFQRIHEALPRVLAAPDDLAARADMLLGAALAGIAIEHSMLGAAHALANPLTARLPLAHGHAVMMLLPAVVTYNAGAAQAAAGYAELAWRGRLGPPQADAASAVEALLARLRHIFSLTGLPRSLAECGLARDALPAVAAEAARQWTAQFNPRPVDGAALLALLEATWGP